MKLKKEYLILIAVIAALAAYLIFRNRDSSHMNLPQPAALDSKTIDRIVISQKDATLELIKKDGAWEIQPQGYAADPGQMTNMLNTIADLRLTALVSESGNYDRYGLSDEDKINVQAFSGDKKVREFDVGQVAPTFRHTFVRVAGDPNVYHARGAFKNNFDNTVDTLRDKTILTFDRGAIVSIDIQKGDKSAHLEKKVIAPVNEEQKDKKEQKGEAKPAAMAKTQWQNAAGKPVDSATVDRLLAVLAALKCDSFLNDQIKENQKSPSWTLTLKDAAKTYSLSAFAKLKDGDSNLPAVSSASPYVFALSEHRVQDFEEEMDTLMGIEKKKEGSPPAR